MKKAGIYSILIFCLIVFLDNSMATEDRSFSQEETRHLEYYELHEASTPSVKVKEVEGKDTDDTKQGEVKEAFVDEVAPENYQKYQSLSLQKKQIPAFSISQGELNQIYKQTSNRIAYLTFDDGPSEAVTPKILDILKEQQIKATFFVVGKSAEKNPELIKRIFEEWHMLANHTFTHDYSIIYSSSQGLIEELNRTEDLIQKILEVDYPLRLMRFPGGSYGEKSVFKRAINEAGYLYLDWNSLNGDAEGQEMTEERLMHRFISTAINKDSLIILLHDTETKSINIDLLPKIIKYLREEGYVFDSLLPVIKASKLN